MEVTVVTGSVSSGRPVHDERLAGWSRRHGGIDPRASVWVRGWLRLVHGLAAPLARRGARPDVVTAAAVLVAATVPLAALAGSAWPLAGLVLVVAAGVLDGVDGAVAVQQGRDSAWGEVWDQLADRCSDVLVLGALLALGAPAPLVVAVVVVTLLLEGLRSSARAAGMSGVGTVTVWERPSRVIVVAVACAAVGGLWCARDAGIAAAPGLDATVPATTVGAVGAALALVGFGQLLWSVRRAVADGCPRP